MLAEFIVATALGIPTDGVREGWAAWDLTTPGGVRVEVKTAAYLQSWAQKELSKISFSTPGRWRGMRTEEGSPKLPGDMPKSMCSHCWPIPTRPR